MKRIRMLVAATVAAAVGTAALPAAPASAAPSAASLIVVHGVLTGVPEPTATSPVSSVNATVPCQGGTRVVGTGIGSSNGGYGLELPQGSNALVTGNVTYSGPQTVATLQTYTICAPAAQFSDVTTVAVGDQTIGSSTARAITDYAVCPTGKYAFGGGAMFTSGPGTPALPRPTVLSNSPTSDGQGWLVTATPPAGAKELVMTVQCAPRLPAGTAGSTVLSITPSAVAPGTTSNLTQVTQYAFCQPGYHPISGGFFVTRTNGTQYVPTGPNDQYVLPIYSIPVGPTAQGNDPSWYSNVYTPGGTRVWTIAVCEL